MEETCKPPADAVRRGPGIGHAGNPGEFESLARGQKAGSSSAFVQLLLYVKESRRWWLLPVIIALVLAGLLIVLGSTAAAPFIYTLF